MLNGVCNVGYEHHRLHGAETEDALTIALPDGGGVITQDLVYNRAHLFLGERRFAGWREALRQYRDLPYDIVLPGHGLPGDKTVYADMIDYLNFAEDALVGSSTAAIQAAPAQSLSGLRLRQSTRPPTSFSVSLKLGPHHGWH
jgi:glyoxylase-like metal-dependent hydrolase (beta-lactamase superfamily II)